MKRFKVRGEVVTLIAGWAVGFVVLFLRLTCRLRFHNDPRYKIAAAGKNAIYATIHANQLCGSMAAIPGTATMVSRSADGGILVPGLKLARIVPIRGSSGGGNKGGATALVSMVRHMKKGHSAMIAVDGPNGPRGNVQKGIGLLARKAGAPVIPCVAIPTRRWILTKTWDRMQIPKPFSTVNVHCTAGLHPEPQESLEDFAKRVEIDLQRLEARYDPDEAAIASDAEQSTLKRQPRSLHRRAA